VVMVVVSRLSRRVARVRVGSMLQVSCATHPLTLGVHRQPRRPTLQPETPISQRIHGASSSSVHVNIISLLPSQPHNLDTNASPQLTVAAAPAAQLFSDCITVIRLVFVITAAYTLTFHSTHHGISIATRRSSISLRFSSATGVIDWNYT